MTDTTDNGGSKTTITLGDGEEYSVDPALFVQYRDEAFEYLKELNDQKANLKAVVDTMSEVTGIPKGVLNKYLKARYEDKLKEAAELAETFETLDAIKG